MAKGHQAEKQMSKNSFLFITMSKRPFGVQIVFPNKNNPLDVCDVLWGSFLSIMSFEPLRPDKEDRIGHSPSATSLPTVT